MKRVLYTMPAVMVVLFYGMLALLAGGVGGTVAQIAGMDTLSCGETAVERPQKSGISPFIFTVVSGIVVFICGGNCLYFDRVESFPVVCLE